MICAPLHAQDVGDAGDADDGGGVGDADSDTVSLRTWRRFFCVSVFYNWCKQQFVVFVHCAWYVHRPLGYVGHLLELICDCLHAQDDWGEMILQVMSMGRVTESDDSDPESDSVWDQIICIVYLCNELI